MELEEILKLIQAVDASSLTCFSLEQGETRIHMEAEKQVMPERPVHFTGAEGTEPVLPAPKQEKAAPDGQVIKAPLVGTFYSSASPESAPFVQVGDSVKKGQVLGIVEAMKLMNEIESEYDGVVTEILIQNEQVVEYGQPLFVIA